MRQTRTGVLAGIVLTVACLGGVVGCGSDDAEQNSNDKSAPQTTAADDQDPSEAFDDATAAVGTDRMLTITADQLVGKFGFTGYEIDGDRLVLENSGDTSLGETNCTEAGLVLGGVGVDTLFSVKYDDGTVDCEEFA